MVAYQLVPTTKIQALVRTEQTSYDLTKLSDPVHTADNDQLHHHVNEVALFELNLVNYHLSQAL